MSRFNYTKYDEASKAAQSTIKVEFESLESTIHVFLPGNSLEKARVMTKLEEAYMWVGKAIRNQQLLREGGGISQEERKDG